MSDKIYVTGMGIVCAIGNNTAETFDSLVNCRSGIGKISLPETIHRDVMPAAEVRLSSKELLALLGIQGHKALSRTSMLGMLAAKEAMLSAGNNPGIRTGLISATTVGGMDRSEHFYPEFLTDPAKGKLRDVVSHECADSTERIAEYNGIRGFVTTISTACSSSVNALILGSNMIRAGLLDRVLVGGTDAITRFTVNGFNALMILDKNSCRPFDAERAGLTIGEGAAYLLLESEESLKKTSRTALAQVSGYGNANDAFHQTASSPDGAGAWLAMNKALKMSGITPDQIDYINVHGTGTQNNDLSEGMAIQKIFNGAVPPFSSTKSYTGHTLGAAGAVESVISILALKNQVIFPNLNFKTPMNDLNIKPITQLMTQVPLRHVLSNSFGFGGNNSSVIFSKT